MPLKIGLADVDSHNFPNLPLMKLSAFHKKQGDAVEMCIPVSEYDIVYKSKVFTYTPDMDYQPRAEIIYEGGTGYAEPKEYHNGEAYPNHMINLPEEIERIMPDYNLYSAYDEAYGFLTRGCPRACSFCICTAKEGSVSYKVADLSDFHAGQKVIKLLDPNLLACADREDLLIQLADSKSWVDFSQGLDARLIDEDVIGLLNKIKTKVIHFAWDNPNEDLIPKFKLFDKYSKLKHYTKRAVYVLTNYNSTHEQDLERVYRLKELGYNPFIMVYDKQNAPPITKRLQRWVNNRRVFRSCDNFDDYMSGSTDKGRRITAERKTELSEQMQGQLTLDTLSEPPPPLSLGSLFDGIGGFVLAAKTVGITPLWASEIEPNCIAITKNHFPDVPHLGDITAIDGAKIPPADIASFGSPCQDLSISNNRRAGLSGERSGLFMEAVRIIKQMRAATNNTKPRYAIWENVPGALNSNDGGDFRIVLEELLNIAVSEMGGDDYSKTERTSKTEFVTVPKPPKWGNAGSIVGDNGGTPFSISWRVLDSQYFGVPQRRKRIFLICDFGGGNSEEILFERESLSGDSEPGEEKEQDSAAAAEGSAQTANIDVGVEDETPVLRKSYSIIENIINRSEYYGGNGTGVAEDLCYTLTTSNPHAVVNCSLYNRCGRGHYKESKNTGTLLAHLAKEGDDLVVNLGSQGDRIYCNAEKSCSITAQGGGGGARTGIYFFDANYNEGKEILLDALGTDSLLETIENFIEKEGVEALLEKGREFHINGVRRLTPLECERLMGYEDYWTKIAVTGKNGKAKTISDNARYRALGNSIVVPCLIFLLERLKNSHFAKGETYAHNGK